MNLSSMFFPVTGNFLTGEIWKPVLSAANQICIDNSDFQSFSPSSYIVEAIFRDKYNTKKSAIK